MELQGTSVIVTGAASGMGAETARQFASQGAKVALIDRNLEGVQSMAESIGGLGLVADVTDPESVKSALAEANAQHGAARVCVNCAGVAPAKRVVGREGPMDLSDFSQVIEINVLGTFNLVRLAAAEMMASEPLNDDGERGVIINTASVAAFDGQIGQAAYSASKGAVVAMTLPLAREFAKFGIRVMTIAPGIIDTPMMQAMPDNVRSSLAESIPFPSRLGYPSEYASLAAHIVQNSLLNGEVIRLDGAIRMQPK